MMYLLLIKIKSFLVIFEKLKKLQDILNLLVKLKQVQYTYISAIYHRIHERDSSADKNFLLFCDYWKIIPEI